MKRDTFVYWMYDAEAVCIYVGVTKYPRQRWSQHQRKAWIGEVASRRMAGPFTAETARRIERQQQDELQPRHDQNQAIMRARARLLPAARTRWSGSRPAA